MPVISVDTKKKELVGNFKNGGPEWQPKGVPELVDVHDFPATPSARRSRTASTTLPPTTASSVSASTMTRRCSQSATIEAWWKQVGSKRYPDARELFITADAGGSNGYRARVWKAELQRLADKLGIADPCQPLPAGHEQVEQDRAPALLVHLDQLARSTAAHVRDRRQPDREHDEPRRPRGPSADRPRRVTPLARRSPRRSFARSRSRRMNSMASGTTSSDRAWRSVDQRTYPFAGPKVESKAELIGRLAADTIAVLPGVRVVLVEDEDDRRFHQWAYDRALKLKICPQGLRLVFMPVNAMGGGGKTAVIKRLEILRSEGLGPVHRGLVDRDNDTMPPPPGVARLNRYSLENYLTDPIALYCVVVHNKDIDDTLEFSRLGGVRRGDLGNLRRADVATLQRIADLVLAKFEHAPTLTEHDRSPTTLHGEEGARALAYPRSDLY